MRTMYEDDLYDGPNDYQFQADLEALFSNLSVEVLRGRKILDEAPGYRLAIEENPDLWQDALDAAQRKSDAEVAQRAQTMAALEDLTHDAEVAEKAVPTLEELCALRDKLGRKFEPSDVTMGLREAAEALAKAYDGDFEYMVEMRKVTREKRLSIGQAKGVLNSVTARRSASVVTPAAISSEGAGPGAVQSPPARSPSSPAAEGFYLKDGEVYKVQLAVHGSGKPYAKKLVLGGERHFDFKRGYDNGDRPSWEFARGMVYKLKPEDLLTLEQAQELGKLYGVCMICGAILTDEESIERGIGPICARKLA